MPEPIGNSPRIEKKIIKYSASPINDFIIAFCPISASLIYLVDHCMQNIFLTGYMIPGLAILIMWG
jgi:hypothetical protein